MIEVIEVLPGSRAVVSTKGLCRVVAKSDGEVVGELAELGEAAKLLELMATPEWNEPGRVVFYDALCSAASS